MKREEIQSGALVNGNRVPSTAGKLIEQRLNIEQTETGELNSAGVNPCPDGSGHNATDAISELGT